MKIGILGSKGRLGKSLVDEGYTPIDLNVTDEEEVKASNLDRFDVIINCAAKTKVDLCLSNNDYFEKALKVNTRALEYIRANFLGRLIHISTDYVFKCDKGPYDEKAKCLPVNPYGWTKFGGEVVLETCPLPLETIVVRTTGLYGSGEDFASFVLDCLRKDQRLVASNELRGNQTYIPHLAEALVYIAGMTLPEPFMYLHVGSSDVVSRYEFALMLANKFNLPPFLVEPVKNKDIPSWIAPRPTRGGLKVKKAQRLGVPIYSILEGLNDFYNHSLL